jgi:hypothetical protein
MQQKRGCCLLHHTLAGECGASASCPFLGRFLPELSRALRSAAVFLGAVEMGPLRAPRPGTVSPSRSRAETLRASLVIALCSTPPAGGVEIIRRDALRPDPLGRPSRAARVKVAAPAAPRRGRLDARDRRSAQPARWHVHAPTRPRRVAPCSGRSRRPLAGRGLRRDLDPPCARRRPERVGTKGVPLVSSICLTAHRTKG